MKKWRPSGLLVMAGILFVLIGLFCLLDPLVAYVYLVKFSGLALLFNGVVLQAASSSTHITFAREKLVMRIESILDFTFAILLLFNPFMTVILYSMLIGYWILCVGILKIIVSLMVRKQLRGWVFILVVGILSFSFALGILNSPSTRAKDITLVIGAFFVTLGAVLIFDSVKLRRKHEMIDLLF